MSGKYAYRGDLSTSQAFEWDGLAFQPCTTRPRRRSAGERNRAFGSEHDVLRGAPEEDVRDPRPFASAYDDAVGVPVRCGVEYSVRPRRRRRLVDGDALRFQSSAAVTAASTSSTSWDGAPCNPDVGIRRGPLLRLIGKLGREVRYLAWFRARSSLVSTGTRTRRIPSPRTTLSPVIVTGRSARQDVLSSTTEQVSETPDRFVRQRKSIRRPDGTRVKFEDNAAVIIDEIRDASRFQWLAAGQQRYVVDRDVGCVGEFGGTQR